MPKRVLILIEQDFQDMEAMYPYYRLKEAGFDVKVAGSEAKTYKGKYGYPVEAEKIDNLVVVDKNLITSRKPDDLPAFCREIIKQPFHAPSQHTAQIKPHLDSCT